MNIIIINKKDSSSSDLPETLRAEGFAVSIDAPPADATAVDPAPAAELALIVADDADAALVEEIAALRARQPRLSLLVVTDADDLGSRLACYGAGADDCLTEPLHIAELVAKIEALRRRRSASLALRLLDDGNAAVDCAALELKVGDRTRGLTRREADLLATFARAEGAAVRREDILRVAWGAQHDRMTSNSVDVYVGYARRKLEMLGADVTIAAVRGVGFQVVRIDSRRNRVREAG